MSKAKRMCMVYFMWVQTVNGVLAIVTYAASVTFSDLPDPFHWFSFYTMPRTIEEAKKDYYAEAEAVSCSRPYSIWCRKRDYRVCVLFDKKRSVAGIQVSLSVEELKKSKSPLDLTKEPQWERKKVLGVEVWSATTFFVSQCVLHGGGREMKKDTPTAKGIYIKEGENKFLTVPFEEDRALSVGFTKQGCTKGMGRHYFYNTTPFMSCDCQRPYFLLYGPKTQKLEGFGVFQYGEVSTQSQGRGWFETPGPSTVKSVLPNGPIPCLTDWVKRYKLISLHIYFVDKPWSTRC